MKDKEFYGNSLQKLKDAEEILRSIIERYQTETHSSNKIKPVEKYHSRIKSSQSMIQKLERLNLDVTIESALSKVYDAVGIRIICGFIDDVYRVVEWLSKQPELEILTHKDYISYPKPNGYRSYHLQIRIKQKPAAGVLAEIQIRTMAIDFWATLEHELKYKKAIKNEDLIRKELKRCADEIAATDLSMQTLRDIIEDSIHSV